MATATYNTEQQVAAFTFSVNSAADLSFSSLAAMQAYVTKIAGINLADTTMQGLMGSDWTPIWGPVVWVNPSQQGTSLVVDNTMACYFSQSQNLFVIAIAGTNPGSMFDWEKEDADITTMVAWNTISPASGSSSGYISTASNIAFNALMGMQDNNVSLLTALKSYINSNKITGSTVAVGGHSLGGTIAPCIGLYLNDNLSTLGLSGQNIAVYVYAGPTPGDQNFATYYESKINTTSFTYSSQYNSIDIIPQASVIADIATIPTIYGKNISFKDTPPNTFLGVLTTALQLASYAGSKTTGASAYTQISTNRTSLSGTFNTDVYNNCSSIVALELDFLPVAQTYMSELGNFINFMYQAVAQHGPAYCGGTVTLPLPELGNLSKMYTSQPVTGALGIDDFTVEFQSNLSKNPAANATFNSAVAVAIKRIAGINIAQIPPAASS